MKTKRKHEGGYVVQKYQHDGSQLEKLSSMFYETEEDIDEIHARNITFLKVGLVSIICFVYSILFYYLISLNTTIFESSSVYSVLFLTVCIVTVLGLHTLIKRVINVNQSLIATFMMILSAFILAGLMVFYINESKRINVNVFGGFDLIVLGIIIVVSHLEIVTEVWDF